MAKVLMSVAQFCNQVGVGKTTAYKLIANREIIAVRIGRRTFISEDSAADLIERSSFNGGM
jgi:excisionase family DNA binding protein